MRPMLTLVGVLVVIVGFVLRLNPLLVIFAAAFSSGLAAGLDVVGIISALGKAFVANRYLAIVWLILPVIGVLERAGLRERAQSLVGRIHAATAGRILLIYFAVRQITAALGLTSLGGHAQMVRPLVAPMAEAAAESRLGALSDGVRYHIRAHAAAVDNIALFFGEDIFVAIGSILLMKSFLAQRGHDIDAFGFAVWAIPTAVLAFLVHGARLLRLDRRLHDATK
jgi:uncharacterized membrane protein